MPKRRKPASAAAANKNSALNQLDRSARHRKQKHRASRSAAGADTAPTNTSARPEASDAAEDSNLGGLDGYVSLPQEMVEASIRAMRSAISGHWKEGEEPEGSMNDVWAMLEGGDGSAEAEAEESAAVSTSQSRKTQRTQKQKRKRNVDSNDDESQFEVDFAAGDQVQVVLPDEEGDEYAGEDAEQRMASTKAKKKPQQGQAGTGSTASKRTLKRRLRKQRKRAAETGDLQEGGWRSVNISDDLRVGTRESGFLSLEEVDGSVYASRMMDRQSSDGETVDQQSRHSSASGLDGQTDQKNQEESGPVRAFAAVATVDGEVEKTDEEAAAQKRSKQKKRKRRKQQKKKQKQAMMQATEDKAAGAADHSADQDDDEQLSEHDDEQDSDQHNESGASTKRPRVAEPETVAPLDPAICDVWRAFGIRSEPILRALCESGFDSPTPVQRQCLPAILRDRKDVVAAAETGSGKTLAFGLPILQLIWEEQEEARERVAARAEARTQRHAWDADAAVSGKAGTMKQSDDEQEEHEGEEELDEQAVQDDSVLNRRAPRALILAPTRELALQVMDHMRAAAKYTTIRIVSVVGGLAVPKQRRLLGYSPEIVVATPGRLWQLIHDGEEYLVQCGGWTRFLVLDEADRMLETGHFAELEHIVGRFSHNTETHHIDRFTMLFSATLTVDPREWVHLKRRVGKAPVKQDQSPLGKMIQAMPFEREQMETVDLSNRSLVASRVTEYKMMCSREEKDFYLYYLLCSATNERTLVFVNAIETLRRLIALLTLLRVPAFPLHAELQQRQRLRNLDRFRAQSCGVLVATDVAARGIDVPSVHQVVHYQLPRTVEVYVHRCGRTARGSDAHGRSVALLGEQDLAQYRRLLAAVHKQTIPDAPLDLGTMAAIRSRVKVAHRIDRLTRQQSAKTRKTAFLRKAAHEMDLDLDGLDVLSSEEEEDQDARTNRNAVKNRRFRRELGELRAELAQLLREPLQKRHVGSAASTVKSTTTNLSRIRKGGVIQASTLPPSAGGFLPIST
eukprot:CAMPEP_0174236500 /NCGR_PEP_ID=MMETSP0417-20130205/5617_1 /TAXON_ID=242541 /ORGANISM="Mayorella sp, Strain BSH-02190019" /LENGTH=1019 /DNA_ID=CAMNT_0015315155 /DNA_START=21 /DNA_END=3076 /DNA_ORIENTATION=+